MLFTSLGQFHRTFSIASKALNLSIPSNKIRIKSGKVCCSIVRHALTLLRQFRVGNVLFEVACFVSGTVKPKDRARLDTHQLVAFDVINN